MGWIESTKSNAHQFFFWCNIDSLMWSLTVDYWFNTNRRLAGLVVNSFGIRSHLTLKGIPSMINSRETFHIFVKNIALGVEASHLKNTPVDYIQVITIQFFITIRRNWQELGFLWAIYLKSNTFTFPFSVTALRSPAGSCCIPLDPGPSLKIIHSSSHSSSPWGCNSYNRTWVFSTQSREFSLSPSGTRDRLHSHSRLLMEIVWSRTWIKWL